MKKKHVMAKPSHTTTAYYTSGGGGPVWIFFFLSLDNTEPHKTNVRADCGVSISRLKLCVICFVNNNNKMCTTTAYSIDHCAHDCNGRQKLLAPHRLETSAFKLIGVSKLANRREWHVRMWNSVHSDRLHTTVHFLPPILSSNVVRFQ